MRPTRRPRGSATVAANPGRGPALTPFRVGPTIPIWRTLVEPGPAGRLSLTRRGRLLANEVALRLLDVGR